VANDPWNQWKAFAEQTARAVPGALPIAELAGRFAAAARAYLEKSSQAPQSAADEAAAAFGNFLRDQAMACCRFPWSADSGGTAPAPWGPMADLPALGLSREHQQRWQRMADAALRVADAQRRLQTLWSDALRDAAAEFAARLSAGAGASDQADAHAPGSPRDAEARGSAALRRLYDSWIDCAERAYAAIAHSEPFSSALADFVNAGSSWRREFTASIEHGSKLIDLPTRGEINSLNARLMAVEEQLRTARRQPAAAAKRRPGPKAARASGVPAGRRARAKRAPRS